MKKTYKVRAIEAAHTLIEKYEGVREKEILSMAINNCALCYIYRAVYNEKRCAGCPLADDTGNIGCTGFNSFPKIIISIKSLHIKYKQRIKFWQKVIPILESLPAWRFVPRQWRYFDELDRSW